MRSSRSRCPGSVPLPLVVAALCLLVACDDGEVVPGNDFGDGGVEMDALGADLDLDLEGRGSISVNARVRPIAS